MDSCVLCREPPRVLSVCANILVRFVRRLPAADRGEDNPEQIHDERDHPTQQASNAAEARLVQDEQHDEKDKEAAESARERERERERERMRNERERERERRKSGGRRE